jgi:hypothetical protein
MLWCVLIAASALSYYLPGEDAAETEEFSQRRKVTEWAR